MTPSARAALRCGGGGVEQCRHHGDDHGRGGLRQRGGCACQLLQRGGAGDHGAQAEPGDERVFRGGKGAATEEDGAGAGAEARRHESAASWESKAAVEESSETVWRWPSLGRHVPCSGHETEKKRERERGRRKRQGQECHFTVVLSQPAATGPRCPVA